MEATVARQDVGATACTVAAAVPALVLVAFAVHGLIADGLIALGTGGACYIGYRRTWDVRPGWVVAIVVALALASCARAPTGSHDLWSYAMYGRIFQHYGADPYHVAPITFRSDPVLLHVGWRHTVSVYGPVFVGWSAIASALAGAHVVALRLWFQISSAIGVALMLAVIAHETRRAQRVVFVALQPMVWGSVVNGGHNDVFVALAALYAIVLARRHRVVSTAIGIGLAALVKSTALLALVPLVVGRDRALRGSEAVRTTIVTASVFSVGALIAPVSLTAAMHATAGRVTQASVWNVVVALHVVSREHASTLALVALAAAVTFVVSRPHANDPAATTALVLGAFSVVGSYVLPWYALWGIPVATVARRLDVAVLLAVRGAALLAAYELVGGSMGERITEAVLTVVVPLVIVAAFVVVSSRPRRPVRTMPVPT
jgi:alpha-1,6-mannosyltransferase